MLSPFRDWLYQRPYRSRWSTHTHLSHSKYLSYIVLKLSSPSLVPFPVMNPLCASLISLSILHLFFRTPNIVNCLRYEILQQIRILNLRIDPFTVDQTGDWNGVFEITWREIMDLKFCWLSIHFAGFLCVIKSDCNEILTGPSQHPKKFIYRQLQ